MNDDLCVVTAINFWFINCPLCSFCRLLDEIRTNSFDASYSVYCTFMMVLMFEQLSATCAARMRSSCGHVSVFLRVFWPLVLHFPLIFPLLCIFSLFNFCSRVCFFSKLPFSVLSFRVSPPCFYFFFSFSMVDYSAVRVDVLRWLSFLLI